MRKALALIAIVAATTAQAKNSGSGGTVHVKPHVTKDGTYVPPHVRTAPNNTKTDNWSSKPNTNPYTGKQGTQDPYKQK